MADEIKTKPEAVEAPKAAEVKAAVVAPQPTSDPVKESLKLLLTHFAKRDATQQEQSYAVQLLGRLQ
jgi:hypothetical protein